MQVIQEEWKEVLGLEVRLEKYTHAVQLANLFSGNFEMLEMGWISWLRDPIYMLDTFRVDNGTNGTGWSNAEYQACLAASEGEVDPSTRLSLFKRGEEILMDEQPFIPLWFDRILFIPSPYLEGVLVDPSSTIDFTHAHFTLHPHGIGKED